MLENITPSTIKSLSESDKIDLCAELRNKIISTVKKCGGHLASNLGIVELTVALLDVFNFPEDRVIFDVGHQCYPYKLLTGRYDHFETIRQKGGLSGFPKRTESEYDSYDTGHAGNSISAAMGLEKALRLQNKNGQVIAVIGDGSFNNGLVYEALNSLTMLGCKILVILNDNDMSISPTVGKTHDLLSEDDPSEKSINISLIEQYGLKYIGDVDGNDLSDVTCALQKSKEYLKDTSVLLHIHTVKGRGYDFCEENPTLTHGLAPDCAKSLPEYSKIFGKTIVELGQKDKSVVVVSAAMTDALGLRPFFERYPERAFDVGICEENASVLCGGMACGGLKPYYAIYSTFLQRAFDEIIHDIAAQDLPVTFCIDRGGLSGSDGETHQGVFDLAYLSLIPNMTIAVPKDGEELKDLLEFSLGYAHPLAIRYPRSAEKSFGRHGKIEAGSFEYLEGDGKERVTVLACGERMISLAYQIKEETGKDFAIVNARFVKPLDEALLSKISSPTVITLEDGVLFGGFGDQVARFYRNQSSAAIREVKSFGYKDSFIPHGGITELQQEYGLNRLEIKEFILKKYAGR